MKIQKKDKQMSATHVLKHTPSAAASNASDQNAQTTFPIGLLGKEQLRIIGGPPNHCMAHPKHSGLREAGPAASSHGLRPLSINSEEDDGGGGTRVKKKRRKKDKKESEWHKDEESNTKPKRREQKEGKELLARKAKVAKEQKDHKKREPKAQKEVKKVKKGQDVKVKTQAKNTATHPPSKRGRKPKEQGAMPPEKKKKGKRKSDAVLEMVESDDTTSLSTLATGEESIDPMDNTKRRSGRQVKRRKYNEDLDFKVVDDDGETIAVLGNGRFAAMSSSTLAWQAEEPPEDEANIIEKILSARTVKKETSLDEPPEEMEEFYVKFRNFSYLHCKWATLEELEKDPRISQKMKRFRNKQAQMKHIFTEPDEDLFNPDYIEVDRVLEIAITTDTETGEEVTHYLVKWCSLSYEESTWELQEDVDPVKIREFEDLKEIPEIKHVERPLPEQWQKLEKSREYRNGNQLREYQLEGMNWLLFNWYNRKNCILADEMGLGKTIQSITFLYEIFLMGLRGPFLIIAPLSTITNWEREFRTWTEINVIVYHGSQISRQMILQYEMYHRDEQGNIVSGQFKFHGIITTFEMIMADCPELKKLNWCCVVIDEAHRLKNRNCKLLEGLKLMNLEHKVLLTGTPLQNSVEELFSLLNFLEPSQFPSETTFLEEFGDLKTEEQVKKLQAILKPMMLRRLKDDVEKNLAPKEETIIEVELTNIQKKYYRAILEKNFAFLAKGANQHNMPNLINTMMELRKCCNHPYLITGAEEKILESFKKTYSSEAADFQLQAMIQAAGKLVLIDKLLPKLLAGGHKVLVFSQMVRCLDILEDYLIQRRYTYERIDGRVRGNLRQAAIDRFSKVDSDRFVFLLCTRAGGLGINLTAADTCIIFDSDWNPQNDLQAQARCHRIGQSKAVKVYRLITRNSYEREMFDKASLKLGLDKAVLQDINRKGSLNGVQQLSKMEVEDLLRKGAYGALMDEEDEGSKFCEEDIDQILQRRTQTITIQSEGKGSTFAKASFVSSGNRTDISLDDPNFWQKWAKIAELEIDSKAEKESLVIDTPRVRKQTRHYNSFEDDELMEFSELDSDSEERPCRTRRLSDRNRRYLRAECFRVEKNLLIFGWGRWKDILNHGRFKWHLTERDMEVLCRALLVYCVRHYKGDDKIKSFIWDLITPTKDGHNQALQNHSGLSAPVPRGRKGKKLKNQLSPPELKNADWLVHCNPEVVLQDDSYKKHLKQHCNKVLLRVRMLYYLKVEVLGEAANQALEGIPSSKLEVTLPDIDYIEIPTIWWDAEADKSLLIGVHKHGYERYNAMRADPALCFLERVGMPDVTALTVEQSGAETASDAPDSITKSDEIKEENDIKSEESEEKVEIKEEPMSEETGRNDSTVTGGFIGSLAGDLVAEVMEQGRIQWPAGSALTARLRRLITAYQRYTRREPLRHDFLLHEGISPVAWQMGEFRHCTTEPDPLFLEWQRRWTRREQADFYRTVSSFGVVYDPEKKTFDWNQFRALARLERKTDESLERYFHSFVSMCRTACRLPPRKDEGNVDPSLFVEPITEERAARTLYRIELLRKVREQVLRHPLLGTRLQLCHPSLYLPVWWECGKHDRDLLIGVAKHGLSRTDFYILNDPQFFFLEAHRNYVHKENHRYPVPGLPHHHCCLYDANLGHCQSPQPPEYHHTPTQLVHTHGHHQATEVVASESGSSLGIGTGNSEVFLDCPPLDDSLELGSLQHEGLTSDTLHGKSGKEAFNGFPFNSATGGQNMLNSYDVQGELNGSQGDMVDSIAGKLRSDVLVGEQGSSEETGLMAPSVELDELQTPWESSDHAETSDMFNETDPILGAPTLEPSFLDAPQPEDGREGDETLTDCLSMPSSDSQSNPVEPLAPSFMLFKDLNVGETSVDQTDLSASLPEYVPPPPLGLPDVSLDQTDPISEEQEDRLSDSNITHGVPSPEGAESIRFHFEKEDLSPDSPKTKDTLDEFDKMPSTESPRENCLEESQKGEVPFDDSNGDLKDPCEVAFEEPYEKPLTEPEKVPLEESYDLTCDETLQEPCEGFQQDTAEQQLVEETCKEPPEPIEECNLTNTTLSTDYPMPSSLPSSPTTLPDTSVSPGLDAVPKQEFLVDPVVSDVKPEPDSTTQTPHLEQTEVLEVKDKIKDEGAKAPALLGDVDGPRFALPMCEMADSVHEIREPTIAQLLQEKALYSFSEWPKDRVIINRIDSVCHTILKGKWPSSSQQYDSPTSLANTCVPSSAHQRAGFLPTRMPISQSLNFNLSHTVPHLPKERLVAPAFLPERKRPRRGFEFEAEVLAKPSHLGEKIQVGVPHRVNALLLNGWQDAAIDLSKPTELTVGGDSGPISQMSHTVQSAPHKITGIGSIQGSLGLDMAGILQAGLIHPVTGQIVNGCLRRDDSMLRQRRGRRRNVETPDLSFIKRQSMNLPEQQSGSESISHPVVSSTSSQSEGPPATPTTLPTQPPAPSPAPPPASETLNVSMDRETANKGLMEWLRQNPNFNMELSAFPSQNANILHSFLERPKQRRHRCKDPSKLDVSSLTGEERVPVVHRNTGRRLGGAMAPAIKELSRWLDANSEYSVAPDWADVVKHSGFLPEGKFTRILSGPVCRDPGPRRRGRRPRSEMPKAPELAAAMGPLFMNGGLIGSMDLVSLPNLRNVPGIPLTGIMGFPHGFATAVPSGEDAKNGLSMLPMMLHSMAAVQPPMYSAHMSGMINQQLSTVMSTATASSTSASVTSTNSTTVTVTSTSSPADSSDSAPQRENASSPMSTENKEDAKQGGEEKKVSASVSTAAATSSSSSSITSTGSHLTFNPFLIPGMSHSLLYPHMFLPPGSIMALPTMPAADSTGSPKRKRKKVREEGAEEGSGNVGVESKGVKGEQTPEQKSQEGGMEEGGPDVNLAQVKDPSDPIKGPSEDKSTEEKDKNEMGEKTESNALNSCDGGD
ncbi:chromodomain-helicase-DNA-binding protein 6-like isoform X2 [Sinocyclocheilus grahami]|uniref:chromodomain-helicase-DNA-binding protein 6-like isoform X1 n=1 Tax=Sinocyclocheilus grahami TaxID=75366 RepID=UPI0007AC7EEE|nr:PREDICTED: chromodomain-helicase-DNA-binding protein 6-like isoform X1 [Sinocyclocheilus grahami]XP_016143062.1 PREDICTED: chromodomain-helicase-DNA-binding protein 6-like isoform X2 [Sinocyclocheilus grahami]